MSDTSILFVDHTAMMGGAQHSLLDIAEAHHALLARREAVKQERGRRGANAPRQEHQRGYALRSTDQVQHPLLPTCTRSGVSRGGDEVGTSHTERDRANSSPEIPHPGISAPALLFLDVEDQAMTPTRWLLTIVSFLATIGVSLYMRSACPPSVAIGR